MLFGITTILFRSLGKSLSTPICASVHHYGGPMNSCDAICPLVGKPDVKKHLVRGEALLKSMESNAEKLKKIEKRQHELEVAIHKLSYNIEQLKKIVHDANL